MSYYENRIKALEKRVAQLAREQRMKAIPVEAKLVERIAEYQAENTRLKAEVERLRTAQDSMADSIEIYRLKAEVDLWKLRSDNWQKLCHAAKEGKQP